MSWGCCPECKVEFEFGDYVDEDSFYVECPECGFIPSSSDECPCEEA